MKSNARSSESSRPRVNVEEEVETLLRQLTPHEERIVRLRFGIGTRNHEVVDVAARLSLAPIAVHRIQQSAVRKLWLAAVAAERKECARNAPTRDAPRVILDGFQTCDLKSLLPSGAYRRIFGGL